MPLPAESGGRLRRLERWQKTSADCHAQIEEQKAWITELEKARDWLADQRSRWEHTAQNLQAQLAAQTAPTEPTDRGETWLQEQRTWWEQAACERMKEEG